MFDAFRSYIPATALTKSALTACEACYTRKVRCDPVKGEVKCRQCSIHGVSCHPRTRKRKAPFAERNDEVEPGASRTRSNNAKESEGVSQRPPVDPRRDLAQVNLVSAQQSGHVTHPLLEYTALPSNGPVEGDVTNCRNENILTSSSSRRPQSISHLQDVSRTRHTTVAADARNIECMTSTPTTTTDSLDLQVLTLFGARDLPPASLRKSLISAFMSDRYAFQPVIEYKCLLDSPTAINGSLLLLQVILLVGSLVRLDECDSRFVQQQFFRVKALLHHGREEDPLNLLAALCLMQYYNHSAPLSATDGTRLALAVELALDIGLHAILNDTSENVGLRKRIWWALVARDSINACLGNRPRLLNLGDCTTARLDERDFANPNGRDTDLFICYVEVSRILGDLHTFAERDGEVSVHDKHRIASQLQQCVKMLPDMLKIESFQKDQLVWKSEAAELHVHILTAVALLCKTIPTSQWTGANAPSMIAAFLIVRIIKSLYTQQGWFLGSKIAWHLQVAAVPLVANSHITSLSRRTGDALDSIEDILETLVEDKSIAMTNLPKLRALRRALKTVPDLTSRETNGVVREEHLEEVAQSAKEILRTYGSEAIKHYDRIAQCLGAPHSAQAEPSSRAATETWTALYSRPSEDFDQACLTPAGGMSPVATSPKDDMVSGLHREEVMTLMADFSRCGHKWMSGKLVDGFGALV